MASDPPVLAAGSGAPAPDRAAKSPEGPVLAAIVAAVEMAWPRPVIVVEEAHDPSPWRFSNRWWTPRRSPASTRVRP
jgi:hypothetical protein